MNKYPCPCCRYLTLPEHPPGTFEICAVCFWEDDYEQFHNVHLADGANKLSLKEAQENLKKFGATSYEYMHWVRSPLPDEIPPSD